MGTTSAQKKLFFNLKKIKLQLSANNAGDLKTEHVKEISKVKKKQIPFKLSLKIDLSLKI